MAKYVANEQIRLDVFLAKETGASRSNIKTVVEGDGVFVNGIMRKKSGFELKEGDEVEVTYYRNGRNTTVTITLSAAAS